MAISLVCTSLYEGELETLAPSDRKVVGIRTRD